MKHRNKRRVSLLLVLSMLLSMPAIGLSEPTVTVEQQPVDLSDDLIQANQTPAITPTSGSGTSTPTSPPESSGSESGTQSSGQETTQSSSTDTSDVTQGVKTAEPTAQVPTTLTLAPNAALPEKLSLSGPASGVLGRASIQESFPSLEGISWTLSVVEGDACKLTVKPVSGTASADIAYQDLRGTGKVVYKLTCSVAGVTNTPMLISITVVDTRPTAIEMPKTAFTAQAGSVVELPKPQPVPSDAVFPDETQFYVEFPDGTQAVLSAVAFDEVGEYTANIVAAFDDKTLKAAVTIAVDDAVDADSTEAPDATDAPSVAPAGLSMIMPLSDPVAAQAPNSVTISPTTATVNVGDTLQLTANFLPTGSGASVIWLSSNTQVATIVTTADGNCLVTGVKEGSATITVTTDNGKTASRVVTVKVIAVTKITLASVSPSTTRAAIGDTIDVTAEITPTNPTYPNLTWSSSNVSVATVQSTDPDNGKTATVTITGTGSAYIYATTVNGNLVRGSLLVTGYRPVESIEITNTSGATEADLMVGKTMSMKATVLPTTATTKTVTWTSSVQGVATVSTSGLVTAISAGETFISATANDGSGVVSNYPVTVKPGVSSITITVNNVFVPTASIDLNTNPTLELGAIINPVGASDALKWTSSNSNVAGVDQYTGVVTGYSAGTVTITATATDGSAKYARITITVLRAVTGITITGEHTVTAGKTISLAAKATPDNATNTGVTWSSSSNAATVSATGVVTGNRTVVTQGAQTVTIRATSKSDTAVYGEHTVTVYPLVSSIQILVNNVVATEATIDIADGRQTLALGTTILPGDASDKLTWSSSNYTVASVDSNGVVTGISAGKAVISATAQDGSAKRGSITITCGLQAKGITITGATGVAANRTIQLTADLSPSTTTNKTITWTSSHPAIATVTGTGVTGTVKGAANVTTPTDITITATTKDGSNLSASHTVTVSPSASTIVIYANGEAATTASIDITSGNLTLALTASVLPASATQGVKWASSNTTVATVDADTGIVTGKASGTTTITATATDGSLIRKTITVTVLRWVRTLAISGESAVAAGKTMQLASTITPSDATNKTLEWSVSPTNAGTISTTGLFRANSAQVSGVTVTAKTKDGSNLTASHTFDITPLVSSMLITVNGTQQSTATIDLGESDRTLELGVIVSPSGASDKVTWRSSLPSVATVNATTGKVIGVGAGKTVITATAQDGSLRTATITITVGTIAKSVTITGEATELLAKKTMQLRASILPVGTSNTTLTWTSSNTNAATVSSSGLVTAKAVDGPIDVTITATTNDGSGVKGEYTITIQPVGTSMRILADGVEKTSAYMNVDSPSQIQLTAEITPNAVPQSVAWTSTSTSVARVDNNGLVEARGVGTATITATAMDGSGLKKSITIYVQRWVSSITISNAAGSETVSVLKTLQLTATVEPITASNTGVTWSWSSIDGGSVTVSQSGLVTGVSAGKVEIIATAKDSSGLVASKTVTVLPRATGVTIEAPQGSTVIELGDVNRTIQLKATVSPVVEVSQEVTWTSSSPTVASVSASGLVTGLKIGTTTITATAKDGSLQKGTIVITVNATISSVEILGGDQMIPGRTLQLTAKVYPEEATNKTVTWSIDASHTAYASITSGGLVTAKSNITTRTSITVYATTKDGVVGSHVITIAPAIESIQIYLDGGTSPITTAIVHLYGQSTFKLKAQAEPDTANQEFTWTSANPGVASVLQDGTVTGLTIGQTTITATAKDGSGKKASITLNVVGILAENVTINSMPDDDIHTMKSGATLQLKATVGPEETTDKTVTWTTSESSVATVTSTGLVVAKSIDVPTDVTITARANGGNVSATYVITVNPIAKTITVAPSAGDAMIILDQIYPGSSPELQLVATVKPDLAGQDLAWTSSAPNVATVDENTGLVIGLVAGQTTITAAAKDGSTAKGSIVVTVRQLAQEIVVSSENVEVAVGKSTTVTATVKPDNSYDKAVKWSVLSALPNGCVSVSTSGVITGIKAGSATISAWVENGGASASKIISVDVLPLNTSIKIVSSTPGAVSEVIDLASTTTLQLQAFVEPSGSNTDVTWSSSIPGVATVNSEGQVSGVRTGSTVITATTKDGSNLSAKFTVSVMTVTQVSSITISGSSQVMAGRSVTLNAIVLPVSATNKALKWECIDSPSGVTLSSEATSCTVTTSTTFSGGDIIIKATSVASGLESNKLTIRVIPLAKSIAITAITASGTETIADGGEITINLNSSSTAKLTALVDPSGAAQNVSWTASLPSVAKVDATGTVTAVSTGRTLITVSTIDGSGVTAKFYVNVVRN